jgi:hypothetical protein
VTAANDAAGATVQRCPYFITCQLHVIHSVACRHDRVCALVDSALLIRLINFISGHMACCAGGPASLHLVYLLLSGFQLADPAGNTWQALTPLGIADNTTIQLALQDVRILVDKSTLQKHVQFFQPLLPRIRSYTVRANIIMPAMDSMEQLTWSHAGHTCWSLMLVTHAGHTCWSHMASACCIAVECLPLASEHCQPLHAALQAADPH